MFKLLYDAIWIGQLGPKLCMYIYIYIALLCISVHDLCRNISIFPGGHKNNVIKRNCYFLYFSFKIAIKLNNKNDNSRNRLLITY